MQDSDLLKTPISELILQKLLIEGIAAKDRKIKEIEQKNKEFVPTVSRGGINIIKDTLGDNVNGIFSHADGKMYDSKSKYYQTLKEKGCSVVEQGMFKERKQRGNYDNTKELKEAAQKIGFI